MRQMNFAIRSSSPKEATAKIRQAAVIVRDWMVQHYGEGINLAGHCIEASDLLVQILKLVGYDKAETVEGIVTYDDDRYADSGYDSHVWVRVVEEGRTLFVDVTGDQFNYGMDPENKIPGIVVAEKLPEGYSLVE